MLNESFRHERARHVLLLVFVVDKDLKTDPPRLRTSSKDANFRPYTTFSCQQIVSFVGNTLVLLRDAELGCKAFLHH